MSGLIESFGGHHSRKKPERNFKVFIHKGEKRQIEEWVLMKDNIETGGDLFGLWIDQHTAVVQFVLGPGLHCKRTTVSFYQDVNYLEKAGKYLTEKHGLCNIGQWHSHHRINLPRPSGGDENTVWGNMPNLGLDRYIVFIATIQDVSRKATAGVNCFLFETKNGDRLPVLGGTLQQVQGNTNSPFRLNENICKYTNDGAESVNMLKIIRKTEQSQEILKSGQSHKSNSKETESKVVGTKVAEDRGNKSKTSTSGDQSLVDGQQFFKQSRENENRKDTDEEKKKEMGKTNQKKPKHNTKVSPTHKNEGNSQFYSRKSNNDQTEKRTPVPQENREPAVLREKENRVRCEKRFQPHNSYNFDWNMLEVLAVQDRVIGIPCSHCQKPSVGRCVTCEVFMCEKCFQTHNSYLGFRDHCVLTMEELSKHENRSKITGSFYCKKHENKKLKFFCATCEELICRHCMDFDHLRPEHVCSPMKKEAEKKREALKMNCATLERKLSEGNETLEELTNVAQSLEDNLAEVKRGIKNREDQILTRTRRIIERKSQSLLEEANRVFNDKQSVVVKKKQQLQTYVNTVKASADVSSSLLANGNDEEIILSQNAVQTNVEKAEKEYPRDVKYAYDDEILTYNYSEQIDAMLMKEVVEEFVNDKELEDKVEVRCVKMGI